MEPGGRHVCSCVACADQGRATFLQDVDRVGNTPYLVKVVAGEQDCGRPGRGVADLPAEHLSGGWIKAGKGFVQNDNGRVPGKGIGQEQASLGSLGTQRAAFAKVR